jgi:predicted nucleic acid-binding protein
MKNIVLDTSALIRLYVPDGPLPDGLEPAVSAAWGGEIILLAPELALAEAAQVLRKKEAAGGLTSSEADEILTAVLGLPIEFIRHHKLVADAVALARRHDVTVHDAVFLALAQKERAELITADDRLEEIFRAM